MNKLEQQLPKKDGGKSAVHLVEAWCSELNLCLGQVKTEDKSNEITAIPALLDMLELGQSIISIDAMGCQKTIAAKIVEKEADYILALKSNHETLHRNVTQLFAELTCMHTNACPQAPKLNRSSSKGLWGNLEKVILEEGAEKESGITGKKKSGKHEVKVYTKEALMELLMA